MAKLTSWTNFKYNNFTPNVEVTLNTDFLQFQWIMTHNEAVKKDGHCDFKGCADCATACSEYVGYPPPFPANCPLPTEMLIQAFGHSHGGDDCWCATTSFATCGILQPTEICTIGTSGTGTCVHSAK